MESFGVVVYVNKYYFGIGPKVLFKIGVVQFLLRHHAKFRGKYCSGELQSLFSNNL